MKNNKNLIENLLKKRRQLLKNALNSQEAFWIMLGAKNYNQIANMFKTVNKSLKKLNSRNL